LSIALNKKYIHFKKAHGLKKYRKAFMVIGKYRYIRRKYDD